jgi:Werner syndrome ATP-dependent helicase
LDVRDKCPDKKLNSSQKISNDIIPIITKHADESIIIYCLTKKETEKIAEILKKNKIDCGVYHAGLDADDKTKAHYNFIKGKVKVIAATIAFGMGINKADVRVVIHYGSPKNIEGYYQEIGRAGRDGKKSYCYAFFNFQDFKMQEHFIANSNNEAYQKTQTKLLGHMKKYMTTKNCRRQILLEYFDEEADDKCDFCDNCCGTKKESQNKIITTEQNVEREAKVLINLIESIPNRSFGITMYINILRASTNKSITPEMKKNKYYGAGKHRSVAWWKEMSDGLIQQGFLTQVRLRGQFAIQVIKVSRQGANWVSMSDLGGLLGKSSIELQPITMTTTV